jgi:hypothetical protein
VSAFARTVWLGGWGRSETAQRLALERWRPGLEHHVVLPLPGWPDRLARALALRGGPTLLGGYSTGTLLLLSERELLARAEQRLLLAPVLDFKRESNLGGRTPTTALRQLLRWLERDAPAAILDFEQRAGLAPDPEALALVPEGLCWGAVQLLSLAALPTRLLGVPAAVGAEDPLVDAARLASLCPSVRVLPGVGHEFGALLAALDVVPCPDQRASGCAAE